jgi:protein-L-isoaspartate(D-aspartate) O-methyltransferase
MVERLREQGIRNERVLAAMNAAPRHLFVPENLQTNAYGDHALPIAAGQTISQPYIVARMTELIEVSRDSKVLEIGAGSGYQTAVLAQVAGQVFALERINELVLLAQGRLRQLGVKNAFVQCFDGTLGWKSHAPYDAILVAAGGPEVPQPLLEQLREGGRLVVPVGPAQDKQRLIRVTRAPEGFSQEDCGACAFVPLIGRYGWDKDRRAAK